MVFSLRLVFDFGLRFAYLLLSFLVHYLPDRFHIFMNRPTGHTPSKPGVDMYQQPGSVGS